MSLRNEHYLRLAHNSRRSPADDKNTHSAGVAGVLVAALMLLLLVVTVEHPVVSTGLTVVARTLPGIAKWGR